MTVNAVIDKTTVKDLLHCNQNREALATFLATQPIKCKKDSQTTYVVNSKGDCVVSNTVPIQHLRSGQEEADTCMLLHALDRYRCTRSDALNLLETLSGYYSDCRDRRKRKKYSLVPKYEVVREDVVRTLPGFHAFSECDQTGTISGKSKVCL